ncbi:MAG: hypothetical protein WBE74_25630, partial [Terracidiphilus sp.]
NHSVRYEAGVLTEPYPKCRQALMSAGIFATESVAALRPFLQLLIDAKSTGQPADPFTNPPIHRQTSVTHAIPP